MLNYHFEDSLMWSTFKEPARTAQ